MNENDLWGFIDCVLLCIIIGVLWYALGSIYNRSIGMKTAEDEEFERIERVQTIGWRKRQIEKINAEFDEQYAIHKHQQLERDLVENLRASRNSTLEEVAKEFDSMKALGDTAASFAVYVRNMKI